MATLKNYLLKIMGSPHKRQIDGIGGSDSLSSKVAIVSPSEQSDIDVNYLFCQVHVDKPIVETNITCGNMLTGVAPFAIMKGLVKATDPETIVTIYDENTGVISQATVPTPNGEVQFTGKTHIDGVPGTAAPIKLSFLHPSGSKTGTLLPTGNIRDDINGVPVSCVDVVTPMVIVPANALGKSGYETKQELDADKEFLTRLEFIRKQAAIKMGFDDVSHSICPKICIVSKAKAGGSIHSCYFTPFNCHATHAVSGGLCLAAACFIEGSVAHDFAKHYAHKEKIYEAKVVIEHVSGKITTYITVDNTLDKIDFKAASCIRTARPLFEGVVYFDME